MLMLMLMDRTDIDELLHCDHAVSRGDHGVRVLHERRGRREGLLQVHLPLPEVGEGIHASLRYAHK